MLRGKFSRAALCFTLCAACVRVPVQPQAALTTRQIVAQSKPAIVRVETGSGSMGTGFFIDDSGVIATNLHVVAGESQITARLASGQSLTVTQIAGYDDDRDLALLRVAPAQRQPTLRMGNSDDLQAGDNVIAIGNPLGVLDYSVSNGLISSIRKLGPELTVLQITAPISVGSSGGPLFNSNGEVIGVTTAIITAGQNLNLAVPVNYVAKLAARKQAVALKDFARATQAQSNTDKAATPKVTRRIPNHDVAVVARCKREDLANLLGGIEAAIANGAPLYNQGNHEGCFRIYEGTALRLAADTHCEGIREALREGLQRVAGLPTATERAWAVRDTFDGLLIVIDRYSQGQTGRAP